MVLTEKERKKSVDGDVMFYVVSVSIIQQPLLSSMARPDLPCLKQDHKRVTEMIMCGY